MPKCDGVKIRTDVTLLGEPRMRNDGKLVCLADVEGSLCLVELRMRPQIDGTPADAGKENKMSDDINWLVTVLYGDTLLRCALQVKRDALPGDCAEYPMEPENRKAIHALLPLHVQTCGPIVAVDELFEVHIANKEIACREQRKVQPPPKRERR